MACRRRSVLRDWGLACLLASQPRLVLAPHGPDVPLGAKLAEDSNSQAIPSLVARWQSTDSAASIQQPVAKAPSLTFASPASPRLRVRQYTLHGVESSSPLSACGQLQLHSVGSEHFCTAAQMAFQSSGRARRRFQNTLVVLHKSGLLEIHFENQEVDSSEPGNSGGTRPAQGADPAVHRGH